MIPQFAPLIVVMGAFGSGKTELALALALERAQEGVVAGGRDPASMLIDLDIVNPYFRSSSQRTALEEAGVLLISPRFAMTGVDIPALLPDVERAFEPGVRAVFDVGGDEIGAAALGRYSAKLTAARADVLFVVNALRPMTGTAESALEVFERTVAKARVRPTMLVNNANLQDETTVQDIVRAQAMLERLGKKVNLPIGLVVCRRGLASGLPDEMRRICLEIDRHLKPEWSAS